MLSNTDDVRSASVKSCVSYFDFKMLSDANYVEFVKACHIELVQELRYVLGGCFRRHALSSIIPTGVA
jgi:hypothetical protein